MDGLLLKNSRLCDINCFKFNRVHRIGKYSCLRAGFYGPKKVSTGKPNSHNKLGFCYRRSRKLQLYFLHPGRSHRPADGKEDTFSRAFWASSAGQRNWGKNRRYKGNLSCDSISDRGWSTMHQWHACRAVIERLS